MENELETVITSESLDVEQASQNIGGSRFDLILIASHRARDIANSRKIAERGNPDKKWPCRPTTEALHEIEIGKVGRELLEQIAKEK